jgi:membrane protease YdiL (CAAX protease family)
VRSPFRVSSPSHILRPPAAPAPAELVRAWALAIGGLALAKLVSLAEPTGLLAANLAGVAAFLFIAVPDARLRARGEAWSDYGVPLHGARDPRTWRAFGRGALVALAVAAIVFPLFAAGFWAYSELLPRLPGALARAVAPYAGAPRFELRAPAGLPLLALVQLLVVALPEEMFYRGFVQTAWARGAPERGVTVLGARLGAGFFRTQLLFAAGHLVVLEPWRLATFFPGLLFGWLRERTGSVAAPVVLHALSNLFIATLEASFYPGAGR